MSAQCGCYSKVDKQLAKHGCGLPFNLRLDSDSRQWMHLSRTQVKVVKVRKDAEDVELWASFCPFCGAPYNDGVELARPDTSTVLTRRKNMSKKRRKAYTRK